MENAAMTNDARGLSRRGFLRQAGAGLARGAAGCAKQEPANQFDPKTLAITEQFAKAQQQGKPGAAGPRDDGSGIMPRKRLGKTGVNVTVLGQGTSLNVTPILLNRSLDAGVNYIDTAEGYGRGNSERSIGKILKQNGRRDECFIVSKTGRHNADDLEQRLAGSLQRLQTDRVDLYYLHNLGKPAKLDGKMQKKVEELKASGKIKHFGFSSHHRNMLATMERAAEVGFVEVIMFKYNFRAYEDRELNRIMDKCKEADIGLVAMKTQGGHKSFGDRVDPFVEAGLKRQQAVLRAVYEDERITTIVSAMKSVQHVEENTYAAKNRQLTLKERELLDEYRVATSRSYCRGCGEACMPQLAADTNVPDVLRHLMYYENYGDRRQARALFRRLPAGERQIRGVDFRPAEAACPYGLPIGAMMDRADALLA